MVAVGPATSTLPGENNEQARKDHIYRSTCAVGTHQAALFGLNREYFPALVAYCDVPVGGGVRKSFS